MEAETPADRSGEGTGTGSSRQPKRAVVVIHGIGNQSPMTTLRGFVEAVWTSSEGIARVGEKPRTWAKRDVVSGNYELRRITTNHDTCDRRTDFFEFYWADMMEDTQLSSVVWWTKRLLVRPPRRVPPNVRAAWIAGILGVAALVIFLAALLLAILAGLWTLTKAFWPAVGLFALAAFMAIVLWVLRHRVLVQVVGDAARYLTADPQNIAARARVRAAGIRLLQELHDNPDYDRVVVASHSLGTVIGYDILNYFWSSLNDSFVADRDCTELAELEEKIGALRTAPDDPERLEEFRAAQRDYARVLSGRRVVDGEERRIKWKVTDFVTLGSPLTHAHFLMVDDGMLLLPSDEDTLETDGLWTTGWQVRLDEITRGVARVFSSRAAQRDFPVCPPLNEAGNRFCYATRAGEIVPHHAAVFGPVRWTNIYAPCGEVVRGDVVGGPLRPVFGPGVKDVALTGTIGRMRFAHTHYWDLAKADADAADAEHLVVLRAAINLRDLPEREAWAAYAAAAAPQAPA